MPSFNGVAIFGVGVVMQTSTNQRSTQNTGYAAVNGVESTDLGDRGLRTTATGVLIAVDTSTLFSFQQIFRSFRDGRAYVLVDNFGAVWPNVKLESFEPRGRVRWARAIDGSIIFAQEYASLFHHLTS